MCAELAQPQHRGVSDRRGGTSRTGAKRAGECDGLTSLPEANAGSPGPRPRSRPAWSTRFRAPGCGSSPTGTAGRSRPLSRPTCTAPSQEAAWQALTDFSESDTGVKYPQTVRTWERAWERFTPFLDFPPMLRRVISPPLRGRYPLHQQYRDCELPAAQGSPMNRGHFPSDEAEVKLPKAGDLQHRGQEGQKTAKGTGERTNQQERDHRQTDRGCRIHQLETSPPTAVPGLPRPNQPPPVTHTTHPNLHGLHPIDSQKEIISYSEKYRASLTRQPTRIPSHRKTPQLSPIF